MKSKSRRKRVRGRNSGDSRKGVLETIHLNASGIDIGGKSHWVAVPPDRSESSVREFKCFTPDLHAIADWLEECGIDTVAMESTGVYWVPLYEILEERGFEVLLVNAQHAKGVPGRKTDVVDCQWLQQLHTFGLLRSSFRPEESIVALRSLTRHREQLVKSAATCIHRMQKSLVLMNLHLHTVITDISGVTGLAILRDIASGETSPETLARHRSRRCRSTEAEIATALTGHYKPEQVFVLRQNLELYDSYEHQIAHCDQEIESVLAQLEQDCETPDKPLEPSKKRIQIKANSPRFDVRSPLYKICGGSDLTSLPGIGPSGALTIISEVGTDMSHWETEKHFASWLTLSTNNKISGGKVLASRTRPSANRATTTLRIAAMSIGRSDNELGAFYRRLSSRIGKAKATTATARKLAILVYRVLKDDLQYEERTAAEYDQKLKTRLTKNLQRRAANLGYLLVEADTGIVP